MFDQAPIWDYFQTQTPEVWAGSRARLAYLAEHLTRGDRVLNVGIGTGIFEELARTRGVDTHSLDPSEASILALRNKLGVGEKARVGSLDAIPWEAATFDGVVVSEVLEHLDDTTLPRALAEIARVLRRGGRLLGTVPASEDLSELRVVCPGCGKIFHRWGHSQSFSKDRLASVLSAQLRVDTISRRAFVTWETLNWKGKISALARLGLSRVGTHSANDKLVFAATKL